MLATDLRWKEREKGNLAEMQRDLYPSGGVTPEYELGTGKGYET
jgi:hypothetical protein